MTGRNLLADEDNVQPQQQGRNLLAEPPREDFWHALKFAAPRMILDTANAAYQGIQNLPNRFQQAKTEIPGLYNLMFQPNPQGQTGGETGKQVLAGLAELGMNTFNLPHDFANYATNRLHLLPEHINQVIQQGRMPEDTKDMINQYFGEPKEPGQALVRGTVRNINKILPIGALASTINPMKLTSSNIMNRVVREGDRQIGVHNRLYNNLWRDADRAGINQVPHDLNLLQRDFDIISQYKTPKEYQSIVNFSHDPSLSNAQRALIDIRQMGRKLEEKSKTGSLTSEEINLRNALQSSENHIEGNMFRGKNGQVNQQLLDRYRNITNSYRQNVVPYRYNETIQNYINARNRGLISKKSVEALKNDMDFIGERGHVHPELFRPDQLKTLLKRTAIGGGAIGGIGATAAGINYLSGLGQTPE